MRWLDGITDSMDMNLSQLREDRRAWWATVHAVAKSIISIAFQQNFGNYLVLFSQIAVERIYKRFTATFI